MKRKMCTLKMILLLLIYTRISLCFLEPNVRKFSIEDVREDNRFELKVVTDVTNHAVCQSDFLSIAIDSGEISFNWKGFNFSSPKLQNLAAALSPTNMRLGGTKADFLTFDPYVGDLEVLKTPEDKDFMLDSGYWRDSLVKKYIKNFTMNAEQWEAITTFAEKVGWNTTFDFNLFKWKDGLWDPTNAELLLDYSAKRGINLPAFQLGNEPNAFHHNFNVSILPDTLVSDLNILRHTLNKYPQYSDSVIYGPEVTSIGRHRGACVFMDKFLNAGGNRVVNDASWHHYYLDGRTATVDQFMDPDVLNKFKIDLEEALNMTHKHEPVVPLRLTETSSCYGGGAPGISDRFVAGFMWLDKLGLCAQAGVTAVHRQTFFGGNYALISRELDPNPDFFLSVLYKRLVLGPVLRATYEPTTNMLRVYAHCTRRDFYNYPKGSIVFYFLNLETNDITLTLSQFKGEVLDLFLLTPGDEEGATSKLVKLNNETLLMQGPELPALKPKPHRGDVKIAAKSFGFIVVPNAKVKVCY